MLEGEINRSNVQRLSTGYAFTWDADDEQHLVIGVHSHNTPLFPFSFTVKPLKPVI